MSEQKRTSPMRPSVVPEFEGGTYVAPPSGRSEGGQDQPPPPLRPVPGGEIPPPPPASGCGVVAALTLMIVMGLTLVGVLLPPISLGERLFGEQFTRLSSESNAVRESTLTVAVYGADVGQDFSVAIGTVSKEDFATGLNSADGAVRTAFQSLPFSATPISPLFTLQTRGTAPSQITLSMVMSEPGVPADEIDLYEFSTSSGWRFIPSALIDGALVATVPALPNQVAALRIPDGFTSVIATVDVDEVLEPEVAQMALIVAPAGLQPTLNGTLTGSLAPGFDLAQRYLVMPVLRNFTDPQVVDTDTITAILSSSVLADRHLGALIELARSGYDGIILDYRGIPPELRNNYSAFVARVSAVMRSLEKTLLVVVPAAVNTADGWDTGAYDWQQIGQAADGVQVLMPVDPVAYAPGADRLVEAMMRWAVDQVSRQKLYPVISVLPQRQVGDGFTPISVQQSLSALGNVALDAELAPGDTLPPGTAFTARLDGFPARVDTSNDTPVVEYLDAQGGVISRAWLVTGSAIRARLARLTPFGIAGVTVDGLNSTGLTPDVRTAILDYSLGLPTQPLPFGLGVRWTIQAAGGAPSTLISGLNTPIPVTIAAPEGVYAINADIINTGASGIVSSNRSINVPREGAQISVFSATATPTPSPTPTPTPTPAPTAASAPVSQPSGGGQPAFQPGPGSIRIGPFEYGGHVNSTETGGVGAMQRAGMNWMKVQFRYGPGADPGIAGAWISQAHSRGFKILIGLVGNAGDLAAGGPSYIDNFASFAGQVASQGADAIEVWNEANLDREWPNGQISGEAYASLLARTYPAIKGANSSVMVISAAPAPTGAEAAFPGAVVNDDTWLRQFVAAGGVNNADCIGMHYNEGTVPASARSGDQRDNYYTRYLPAMLDTYWNIIGGAKPLCITELGYLTPEGYPPLDPYFGWAANTTVAQQAAWLAEAAAYASQSGRVRLMIVWNVDFEFYGADPMAGYAIIRPGGVCPACDALAAAR